MSIFSLILTKDYVLSRIENKDWQIFEYQNYYPEVMPFDFTDILDDWDLFLPVMKGIVKKSRKQASKIRIMKPSAMFMSIDERDSKIVKRMIFEAFGNANYFKVSHMEIAAAAIGVWNKQGVDMPVIAILVIGNVVQFAFCFEGAVIIKHVVQELLVTEFNEFTIKCKKIQNEDFTKYIDMRDISQVDTNKMKRMWDEQQDIKIIKVSNHLVFDQVIDREIRIDSEVDFTQIIDAYTNYLNGHL